uniref:Uncharacterized protein n=1 Tax=Arundo donax TaxID=35708 RepID=A0A0A9GPS2_ARUDO
MNALLNCTTFCPPDICFIGIKLVRHNIIVIHCVPQGKNYKLQVSKMFRR